MPSEVVRRKISNELSNDHEPSESPSENYRRAYFRRHFRRTIFDISQHEEEKLEKLKEEVKKMFAATPNDAHHKLDLVDTIQRLGVGYHFEKEIDDYLKYTYNINGSKKGNDNDLHIVALRFRLLRQQGYYVHCNVFNEFMDNESKFKESLVSNVQGMLSLYEAAHMAIHGEEILDEALKFSSSHLKSMMHSTMNNYLASQISEAVQIPIRKSVTRIAAKKFMSIYKEKRDSHDEMLLNFAKLDFNLLQRKHQKELCDINCIMFNLPPWWKALDFENKLPFARDKVVECYFWIMSVYFEPKYEIARKFLTKVLNMTSILDDIYDVEGTLDDLPLFTEAIQRWDGRAIDQLPPYMRVCYQALLDVYAEMEEEMEKVGRSYGVHYAKEEMKKLACLYYEEAKWWFNKSKPTAEEYLNVAILSSGYPMLSAAALVGMVGDVITKEDFEWITNTPQIIEAKVSAVDCHMNEHGSSKEEAIAEFELQVLNAWKDINQGSLITPTSPSMPILMRVVNLARFMHLLYRDYNGYTNSKIKTKEFISFVLIEPVTI
ncbi:hypothetical protein ACJIZ3_011242 [Penstemon smallii]|uniref:Uncharacterized protein n=1 Tax=Penstemon smallii TaxID=265156 RepID=A0ABD3UK21_9LAMI